MMKVNFLCKLRKEIEGFVEGAFDLISYIWLFTYLGAVDASESLY